LPADLPPSLRELYDGCGPVLRFRILRDIAGQDESYVETANMAMELLNHPNAQPILRAQQPNGLWGDFLTTEVAVLHLCELGLARCHAVERVREQVLEPTLTKADVIWEFEKAGFDAEGKKLARRIVRDKTLHMLCRTNPEEDPVVRTFLEQLLVEWELYLDAAETVKNVKDLAPLSAPTTEGYAAVCRYPWSDDEFPRVCDLVKRLVTYSEDHNLRQPEMPQPLAANIFHLFDKWEYLAQPPRLFYDLELAASLGVARDLSVTSWMLEELEARQDADGFFRFPDADEVHPSWYFPVEKFTPDEFHIEYTFRAELIFKLLAYDI